LFKKSYNKGIPVGIIDRKTSSDLYTSFIALIITNWENGGLIVLIFFGYNYIIEVIGLKGIKLFQRPARRIEEGFGLNPRFILKHVVWQLAGRKSAEEFLKIKNECRG